MRPASPTLTPQELEIMKAVWERGEATVRDVYEALRQRRRVAYTTVLTMMGVLERKGHLRRRPPDREAIATKGRADSLRAARTPRSFVYEPTRPRARVLRAMVREFLDRVFGGSAEPLLVHLLEDRRLTPRQLQALARRVREERR